MKNSKFTLGQRVYVSGEVYYGNQWIRVDSEGAIEDIRQKSMSIILDRIDGDSNACVTVSKKYIFSIVNDSDNITLNETICLNDELQKLVDKYVSTHKEDLGYDLEEMLNPKNGDHFYIYLRECGTSFIKENQMFVIQSSSYVNAIGFMEKSMFVCKIHVTNRENGQLFGTVVEIDVQEFVNNILKNKKDMIGAEIEITTRDGRVLNNTSYSENPYHDSLKTLHLVSEQVKEYIVLKYLVA